MPHRAGHRAGVARSITARLIVGLTLGTTLLWCAASAYATYLSYRQLSEAFDRALAEVAERLLPLAIDDAAGREQDDAKAIQELAERRQDALSYQVRDAEGHIILRAHDAPAAPYAQAPPPGFSTVGQYRLFTETDPASGLTITVAEKTRGRDEALTGGAQAMLWPLVGLIPFNILAIWLVVRGSMRRVRRLGGEIAARSGHNLAPLDISDQPAELQPVAQAVARLVERLRAALDAERAFAASSAHELRTPIAGALAQTQRLIAELTDPHGRRRARELEATLKRLAALAEKLMQLARADAGVGVGAEPVDLGPVLDLVCADCAKRLDEPERLDYAAPAQGALVAAMDVDAFAIALRNLIDNAVNHGPEDGTVEIRIAPEGVIRVINGGPVVAPAVLAGLTRRFARGATRHPGSGLGLAIAETIMSQAGGRLELLSPASGRSDGFEARLVLPDPDGPPVQPASTSG